MNSPSLEEAIAAIESCRTSQKGLQKTIDGSPNRTDSRRALLWMPATRTRANPSTSARMIRVGISEYASNQFVTVDPCVRRARRTNVPFVWADVQATDRSPWTEVRQPSADGCCNGLWFYRGPCRPMPFPRPARTISSPHRACFSGRTQYSGSTSCCRTIKLHCILMMIYFIERFINHAHY